MQNADMKNKKTVVILATGGTIAGVGEEGRVVGYSSGALSAKDLIDAVPKLEEIVNIRTVQVCNINSDDITYKIWFKLVHTIHEMAKDPDVAGFVITHGTDTLEETAYFLNLTVKTDKPVILTGSMRPSTSISPDGPMNLYQAVCTAASNEAIGRGVLAVFSDRVYSARSVAKTSTYHVMAISAGETGSIGVVREGSVYLYETPIQQHTTNSEFDIDGLDSLPRVAVIYFSVDADPSLLRYAAKNYDGIVIAGAGAGEFSREYMKVIEELDLPVVISSRVYDGLITQDSVLCKNTVAANNLSPQKAAVLLRLALLKTRDHAELTEIFSKY
ncbi:MAG: asparaginase [Christensenellaceae bacterium]|nr:asparaginase [Christensenellaceae bacterium]